MRCTLSRALAELLEVAAFGICGAEHSCDGEE
jgi:hypothetical protein